jgi:hypothetical protein
MGVCHLMAGVPPDLLLCGVNLSMETVFSGTPRCVTTTQMRRLLRR